MLTLNLLLAIALIYLLVLFVIAYWGDKATLANRYKPVIYSLGLGVYCTSWAFFGVPGQAAETGWWFTPTYTGAILVYIFAWPLVLRVAKLCKDKHVTSLADFISTRYGQSTQLAALITIVAVVAVIPYIALQLRAITTSFDAIIPETVGHPLSLHSTLFFTLLLAIFAILFGTRRIRSAEHNPGLMLAIAFESVVKLLAFLILGVFICFVMFDGIGDLLHQASEAKLSSRFVDTPSYVYLFQTLIGALMMFCLPRQFHMCFIENTDTRELDWSRWLFPIYMVGLNLFVLPVAYAGLLLLNDINVSVDSFMLQLPILADSELMTTLAFLGGFSAASSMVIVASIVLSIMVSNDLITPWLVRQQFHTSTQRQLRPQHLLLIRRITIFLVLMLAFGYHKITQDFGLLANTGLMAMTLLAQFAPALLLGLVWQRANAKAAYRSIVTGACVWLYTLLIPTLLLATDPQHPFLHAPLGFEWLQPTGLFGVDMDIISHGILWSLSANILVFIYYSFTARAGVAEQLEAREYLFDTAVSVAPNQSNATLTINDVRDLMLRFLEPGKVEEVIAQAGIEPKQSGDSKAPLVLEKLAKRELTAIIGGASAKLIFDSAKRYRHNLLSDVVDLVDEASEVLKFNRSLLQSTIQNIDQGIAVVDKELRLVAWNRRYLEMFNYPENEIFIGRPIEEIIRFNAQRGLFGDMDTETAVQRRMDHLRERKPYRFRRVHPNGTVLEMNGNPLPGGGFVTTYTDITEFVETQRELKEINQYLEQRVGQRTQDLQDMNQKLDEARCQAEQANLNKTKYFAAVSHDLLQPFNAAMLFSSVLSEKVTSPEQQELTDNIHNSLENAETLLTSILELTKLDAGAVQPQVEEFMLSSLLNAVCNEFSLMCEDKGLAFEVQFDDVGIRSDKRLLRRVIQNLLTNAVRYTANGNVRVSVQCNNDVLLSIQDTGPGIKAEDQQRIFNDFEQLDAQFSERGLGLGLAIASRICKILGHELTLDSTFGSGSCFSIRLPKVNLNQSTQQRPLESSINVRDLNNITVLVIDNEPQILNAMATRLTEWGCQVLTADGLEQALPLWCEQKIDLLLVDYHLNEGKTGLDCVCELFSVVEKSTPVIVNSADHDPSIREQVLDAGYTFLHKPVKPAALKRQIKRFLK
ncbi:MAG: PAS-domain containing protein [Aestuariibacter sp.]